MQPLFLKETMRFGLSFVRERRTVKQKNRRHTCQRFVNNQIKVGYEK